MDCIFCKIANKEIPSTVVYEDNRIFAFRDLDPQAPEHILVIPKEHIASTNDIDEKNMFLVGEIYNAIRKIAVEQGFSESGYRVVNNCGEDGQQTVSHLHFHILAKRKLTWPPG